MEQTFLNIRLRENTGKGICRRLRSEGKVPAVVYGRGVESVPAVVDAKELLGSIAGEGGRNRLITLKGEKALEGKLVIVSDLTRDCLSGQLLHVDLHKINLQEKVKVPVPVSLSGEAIGVKEGGLLDFAMHTVEVECLANEIPENMTVDVTGLKIGDSIHVGDLQVPAGIRVLDDPMASVVNVLGKPVAEVAPAPVEEG